MHTPGHSRHASLTNRLAALAAGGLLLATASSAPAVVLLVVDITDPTAVTITATGAPAEMPDSSTLTFDGATLLDFFTEEVGDGGVLLSGDLTANGVTAPYDEAFFDAVFGSVVDLNLYTFDGGELQSFTTTEPAFTGSATLLVDFTGFEFLLPAPGTTGDLMAGWSLTAGEIIGDWTVVPEVTPWAQAGVMGLAVLGVAWWRRGWLVRRQG
jgi:hypothetical protein